MVNKASMKMNRFATGSQHIRSGSLEDNCSLRKPKYLVKVVQGCIQNTKTILKIVIEDIFID